MGTEKTADNFFTSIKATVLYLKRHYPGKKVYLITFVASIVCGNKKHTLGVRMVLILTRVYRDDVFPETVVVV